jgi:hypothetical protein
MTNIILVGNGPSLLSREIGSEIDSFDKVVRFNNFELEGFEKHVGKKCSILARRSCDDVKLWPEEMFEEIVCFVTFCKWTRGMIHVANQLRGHYSNINIVPPHVCASYGKLMDLNQPAEEWASVGSMALAYFTEQYDKVAICGFDHLEKDDKGEVKHYFNKPPKDDRFHNGNKEKIFTESLLKKGKVYRV